MYVYLCLYIQIRLSWRLAGWFESRFEYFPGQTVHAWGMVILLRLTTPASPRENGWEWNAGFQRQQRLHSATEIQDSSNTERKLWSVKSRWSYLLKGDLIFSKTWKWYETLSAINALRNHFKNILLTLKNMGIGTRQGLANEK